MASEWYVGRNGQQSGPFSTGQLKEMAAAAGPAIASADFAGMVYAGPRCRPAVTAGGGP